VGGAERVLLDLLASLRAAEPGWETHAIVPAEGPLAALASAAGVGVTVLPFPAALERLGDAGASQPGGAGWAALPGGLVRAAPAALRYARSLGRLLRGIAPTVVHSHGLKMHLLGALARPRGAALLWHLHDYASRRRVMGALLRRAASGCDGAVAVSASVAADAREALGPSLPLQVVPNAVDLARFRPDGPATDLDALAGLPPAAPGTVRVGLVATLGVWKGHEVFLRALSLLPPSLPVRGYVVGGAIYRTGGSQASLEALRERADALGLAGRVGFPGFVSDTPAAMRALDVVVHASTQPEPFGLVIAEGMACGRAVAASRTGGAAEVFADGTEALGYPAGDAAALASVLQRLVGDAGLRARLGAAGRAAAEARFDRARLGPRMASLYRSLTPVPARRGAVAAMRRESA
jgi:glycosyltransferase involved in cell wall biosynthesis